MGKSVEIFRVALNEAKFYKVKVKEVKNKECKNRGTRPDHEF
jgi:hypothetical protein